MPYPRHIRVSVRGTFTSTPEQWSYGFHLDGGQTLEPDHRAADLDASTVAAALSTFHASPLFGGRVRLDEWRAYDIGPDGKMIGNPVLHAWTPGSEPIGTSGLGNRYPSQVALVATLEGPDRGAARFGRMYLPSPAAEMQGDGRISAQDATNYATALRTMLRAIQDAVPGTTPAELCNVSTAPAAGPSGRLQHVHRIAVGRALDTVRSRRTSLVEERQAVNYLD